MSIRTYFDTNFFHWAHEWSEQDRELLKRAFLSGRHSLYPSIELFAELIGILSSIDRRDRLPGKAALLLQLMDSGHVFSYSGSLVRDELLGKRRELFVDATRKKKLKAFLSEISMGRVPSAIPPFLSYIRDRKQTDRAQWQEIVEPLRSHNENKYGRISPKDCSFEEFYIGFPKELFAGWLKKAGSQGEHIPLKCRDVLERPGLYPYANAVTRSVAAWTYLNVFVHNNRRIRSSDSFDIQQLVYLVGLDLLVSKDGNLVEACGLVHGNRVKVTTPTDFFSQLRSATVEAVRPSTSSGRTVSL